MQIKHICVLGGSGFVGSALVHRLSNAGYEVKVLTRRREASKHLILLPQVQVVECDIHDDTALAHEISGADAVINLVGTLQDSGKAGFDALHARLPARVVDICRNYGVHRLLHMSALQASHDAPSAYLRSKAAGEAAVMKEAVQAEPLLLEHAHQVQVTAFRPSVIFGRSDSFLNLFATLVKYLPVILLAKPDAKFQPVYVEDVASAFLLSLENTATYGQVYELAGPRVYTLRELVQYVAQVLGVKRRIVGLNDTLSYLQAFAMELLPGRLMSRDNIASMQVDSTSQQPFPAVFGITPTALETVVPYYLTNTSPRNTYNRFRGAAGR